MEETPINKLVKRMEEFRKEFDGLTMEEKLNKLRLYYNNLTDEEFKQRLIIAGLKIVEDGNGQIIFEEE